MSAPIDEETLNRFLICLLNRHVEKHGSSYHKLKESHFWTIDSFEGILPIEETGNGHCIIQTPSTVQYVEELIEREYAILDRQSGTKFYLTKEGYDAAVLLKHPFRSWFKKYRSEILSVIISAVVSGFIGLCFK